MGIVVIKVLPEMSYGTQSLSYLCCDSIDMWFPCPFAVQGVAEDIQSMHSKISSPSIIKGVFVVSLFLLMVIAFVFLVSNSSSHFLPNSRILSRSSFINAVLFLSHLLVFLIV